MATSLTPAQTVKKLIQCAESFTRSHSNEKAIGSTYGYFTHHPVAPLNRKRLKTMLEALETRAGELKRPLRILDLACGGGIITSAMATAGHRVLGIDLSREEIRLAKLFAQENGLGGMFIQADLLNDPEWEKATEHTLGGKPDVITLAYALHHLPKVEGFIRRLSQWLDPEALLLVNEENPQSPLFRLKHRVRTWIQKDTDVEWHRSFTGWKEILEENGFSVESPQGLDMVPTLGKLSPGLCWSLVFTARKTARSGQLPS
jgi:2-polyprenyl-3-methyl-5-hydroxy-6-metoxy-1,4-benzoquinol methylase